MAQTYVTIHFPELTHVIRTSLRCDTVIFGKRITESAMMTMHRPGGDVCPSGLSTNAFHTLLQPEHPTVLFAQSIGRVADTSIIGFRDISEDLQIPQLLDMGDRIKDVTVVYREQKNRRKWWGLGREYTQSYCYLVLPRSGAELLGVLKAVEKLSKQEKTFLTDHGAEIPEDPVVLWHTYPGDDDGGGDDNPPPEPSPDPAARKTVNV